jgi:hypothetical protein
MKTSGSPTDAPLIRAKRALGQYMTPEHMAKFVVDQLPGDVTVAIDLAAGDGALLQAVQDRFPAAATYGFELDSAMCAVLSKSHRSWRVINADGLMSSVEPFGLPSEGIAVVGNPPFTEMAPTDEASELIRFAFPGVSGKLGNKRSELYFLARSIQIAKASRGVVALVMPIGFADGDLYIQYRQSLMTQYTVVRTVEFPGQTFTGTEARTILLVIDTGRPGTGEIEIRRYNQESGESDLVCRKFLSAGDRLDARFHEGLERIPVGAPTIKDLGATIVRGRISRKRARTLDLPVVHTSNLRDADHGQLTLPGRLEFGSAEGDLEPVIAKTGDILLPRTGSRVRWTPVIVESGSAEITDHVFRIRVPRQSRPEVLASFRHPDFPRWLASISKGVCATVVTKRELLSMPVFSVLDATAPLRGEIHRHVI